MTKIDYILDVIRSLKEESSTMFVGSGESSLGYNIKTETPPVHKKRKKYIYGGQGSRKQWMP